MSDRGTVSSAQTSKIQGKNPTLTKIMSQPYYGREAVSLTLFPRQCDWIMALSRFTTLVPCCIQPSSCGWDLLSPYRILPQPLPPYLPSSPSSKPPLYPPAPSRPCSVARQYSLRQYPTTPSRSRRNPPRYPAAGMCDRRTDTCRFWRADRCLGHESGEMQKNPSLMSTRKTFASLIFAVAMQEGKDANIGSLIPCRRRKPRDKKIHRNNDPITLLGKMGRQSINTRALVTSRRVREKHVQDRFAQARSRSYTPCNGWRGTYPAIVGFRYEGSGTYALDNENDDRGHQRGRSADRITVNTDQHPWRQKARSITPPPSPLPPPFPRSILCLVSVGKP